MSQHQEKLNKLLATINAEVNPDPANVEYGFVVSLVPLLQPDLRTLNSFVGYNIPNSVASMVMQQTIKEVRRQEDLENAPKTDTNAAPTS